MTAPRRLVLLAFGLAVAACEGAPETPTQPTWADVAPILRGECAHCHGSRAQETGGGYRLDFYDLAACGAAAEALPRGVLAGANGTAVLIRDDVSIPPGGGRPRMPPAPGPVLYDWERRTLQRWANSPVKGPPPVDNHPPTISINAMPSVVESDLDFITLVEDPDDDPVIGVIALDGVPKIGMNRTGTFSIAMDLSDRPSGTVRVTAVLCDGWMNTTVDLGPVIVESQKK
jgi:hypothetical protein